MKAFFDKLKNSETYQKWFKDAFPYVTGALLLSVFQIVTFATTGNPVGCVRHICQLGRMAVSSW